MTDNWTYITEEPHRTELLTSYGVPQVIVSLGSGQALPDEVFEFYCNPPRAKIAGHTEAGGVPLVGLFESKYNESYACRKEEETLEYLYFNVKKPEDILVLGDSEQAMFRALFEEIVDSEFHHRDFVTRAAEKVDFRYLADTYAFVFLERELAIKGQRTRDMKAYYERRLAYIRGETKPAAINPGV